MNKIVNIHLESFTPEVTIDISQLTSEGKEYSNET